MSSTGVHLPPLLVQRLDRLAERERVSRNRLIVRACEELLAHQGGMWPEGFFDPPDLRPEDLMELRAAGEELEAAILCARRNRTTSAL